MSYAIELPPRPSPAAYREMVRARRGQGTLRQARLQVAREHGFDNWPAFRRHLRALQRPGSRVARFEAAADAIAGGDAATLAALIAADPGLARARSTREHRSALLHYVSANGVEDFRQKTPPNIVEITTLLLDAGSDVNAVSRAYGGGSTVLGLAATSIHPEQAGVQMALLDLLLRRGAPINQPGAGGNAQPIANACLSNGQPGAAAFLVERGAAMDLVAAAGLGRLDEVRRLAANQPAAKRVKALESACWYGHAAVVDSLLDTGIDAGASSGRGQTGLHGAAYGAHVEVIALLLRRGAQADAKDEDHGATPLDVTLWAWNRAAERGRPQERYYAAAAVLARAGVRLDPEHWRNPTGGTSAMLEKIAADPRMQAALRGEGGG